jgi:hypothetical protein
LGFAPPTSARARPKAPRSNPALGPRPPKFFALSVIRSDLDGRSPRCEEAATSRSRAIMNASLKPPIRPFVAARWMGFPLTIRSSGPDRSRRARRSARRRHASGALDDCRTTHHERADAARAIDNWAYDPSPEMLDVFAWYVRKSRDALPVQLAMMAILAGAVAMMGDDD